MSAADRLRAIEAKRSRLIDRVSGLEPARLTRRPGPEKWSILEIVEHLVLAETDVFGDLDTLGERRSRRRQPRDRLLYPLVMFILRFGIPVRVPSQGMVPRGERRLDELRAEWEANHARLGAWIRASDPGSLERPLFVHPVAGPMTTTQTLKMLDVHLGRHDRQIMAILEATPSPDIG